jgi:hypothetical protein
MKMMNEIVNNLVAKCQQLPDADLDILRAAIMREWDDRKDREKKAAWARVCEAITQYTAKHGTISVSDYNDGATVELYHGCFTFSQYGDIEVGA